MRAREGLARRNGKQEHCWSARRCDSDTNMDRYKTYLGTSQSNTDCERCGDLRTIADRDPVTSQSVSKPCPDCMPRPDAPVVRTSHFSDEPTVPYRLATLREEGTLAMPPRTVIVGRVK